MPTSDVPSPTDSPSHDVAYTLGVSRYDRASSLLIALLILVSIFVTGLVIIFFATRVFPHYEPTEITIIDVEGRNNAAMGFSRDLEPPGLDEAPDLQEPKLLETLTAVTEVSEKLARLDDKAFDGDNVASKGHGLGDSRQAGFGGEGVSERVPREDRWKVRYSVSSIDAYARELDGLGIELGAFGGADDQVYYASHLAQAKPATHTGPAKDEKRLHFYRPGGEMDQLNRQLLQKAGIDTGGRTTMQFLPRNVEALLFTLEKQHMESEQGRYDVNAIDETTFTVVEQDGSYSFSVVSQRTRH